MKKRNLAPYLLFSCFIHVSLLIGAYKFQKLPPEKTAIHLILVETIVLSEETKTIVLREEPLTPHPVPVMGEPTLTSKAIEAKSRLPMHRRLDQKMDNFAEQSPKEGHFEPMLDIETIPVLNIVQKSRKEEKIKSKSMISDFQQPPVQLSPVNFSEANESPLIELEMPRLLSMAESEEVQTDPKTPTFIPIETKSRIPMHRRLDQKADNFSEQSPKEGHFEPSLDIETIPVLNIVQKSRKEEKIKSKSMISNFQQPPVQLSPVNFSEVNESPLIELKMPRLLSMAESEEVQTYPRTLKKTGVSLKKTQIGIDFVAEVQSISINGLPSILYHRKMVLGVPRNYSLEGVSGVETKVRYKSILLPNVRVALYKESIGDLRPMVPVDEPPTLNLKMLSFFSFLGSAKGAAYLFVVDTSGSIKGAPMEGIKNSARDFVSLMGKNDRAGIMTFDNSSVLVAPFTSIKESLRAAIDKLRIAGNQTVLFDALIKANRFISKEDRQNRFIVLFSDGKDEGSRFGFGKVIKETRRSGVSILSVGHSRVERKYLSIMRKLAEKTGGAFVKTPQFHEILTLYRATRDVDIEDSEVKKVVKQGFLKIKSHPIGAQVFVNGLSKGKTPLDLTLPFGTHEVHLMLPNYYDWKAQIELRKEDEIPIQARLLPVE